MGEGKVRTLEVEPNVDTPYNSRQHQHNLISVPNGNTSGINST